MEIHLTPEKFVPPFKRLNQKEVLKCLNNGWSGRATFVKAAEPPKDAYGKYARMAYAMLRRKSSFVSAVVFPSTSGRGYRMVDFSVVAGLEKKGLVLVTFVSEQEATFKLASQKAA
jgi:hypothetical protein